MLQHYGNTILSVILISLIKRSGFTPSQRLPHSGWLAASIVALKPDALYPVLGKNKELNPLLASSMSFEKKPLSLVNP